MQTMSCLRFDHFEDVPLEELKEGDLVRSSNDVYVVIAPIYYQDGLPNLPAKPYSQGPIKLLIGDFATGKEYICRVMDMCEADLHEFDDGTSLIGCLQTETILSPRLPVAELEKFCEDNMDRYTIFFDETEDNIHNRERNKFTPWWDNQ